MKAKHQCLWLSPQISTTIVNPVFSWRRSKCPQFLTVVRKSSSNTAHSFATAKEEPSVYCYKISASSAHTKCAIFRSCARYDSWLLLRESLEYSCSFNSKIHSEIQCSIIFSLLLKYNFFCLISKYSVEKGFLQDTRALSTINDNHRRQDFSACSGLGATFIINKENSIFCENMIKTLGAFRKHTPKLTLTQEESFFPATRCQLLNQH